MGLSIEPFSRNPPPRKVKTPLPLPPPARYRGAWAAGDQGEGLQTTTRRGNLLKRCAPVGQAARPTVPRVPWPWVRHIRQGGHLGPPQSTPFSAPFFVPSAQDAVHEGGAQAIRCGRRHRHRHTAVPQVQALARGGTGTGRTTGTS